VNEHTTVQRPVVERNKIEGSASNCWGLWIAGLGYSQDLAIRPLLFQSQRHSSVAWCQKSGEACVAGRVDAAELEDQVATGVSGCTNWLIEWVQGKCR
jgi:hypothetical protein